MADALHWIGIARMGGNIAGGEENTHAAVKAGKAKLVILAGDSSPGARRRAEGYVFEPGTPLTDTPYTKKQISDISGRPGCSMAAFLDTGLAAGFAEALREEFGEAYAPVAQRLAERRDRQRARNGKSGKRRKCV